MSDFVCKFLFQIGPSQYRGRGGRSFKRGGRGGASYHGRGRGVGGGRHFRSHSAAPAAAGATFVAQSSSSVSEQTLPKPARVQTATVQPRMVYCEICKVECNTPEIMEQHKNGKKHKKNVIVHEKMQRYNAINGQQNEQVPTPQLNPTDQPMNIQESEEKKSPAKIVSSEITADNQKDEIKLQNNVGETSEVPAEMPEGITMENTAARGRGLKRKGRGGKGRKHLRTADGSKLVQVSKPEQPIVFTCELCNVKCESQVVYQSHVTGKKHLKRAHGHQAPSGVGNETSSGVGHQALPAAVGLQALYPPDINALANAINAQVQQGDNDPQVLLAQLLVNVLSQAQGSATAPLNGPLAVQTPTPTSVAGSSYQPLLAQTQVSEITEHVIGMGIPAEGLRSEMSSVPLESNAHEGSSVSTQIEGGSSETN